MSEVTQFLAAVEKGDGGAAESLLPLVYGELRKLAAHKMAGERLDHTLQPTALVHEAWLKLAGQDRAQFQNKAHFFAAAAEAMRRILIDRARRRQAFRHGGGVEQVPLDQIDPASPVQDDQMLAVNEALAGLAAQHPREAELVKLRYFVGMTLDQAAEALGISTRSADTYWAHARAWLFSELRRSGRG